MGLIRKTLATLQARATWLWAILGLAFFTMSARADTDVTAMVTDASTLWSAVKIVVLGIVGFLILLSIVKLVKRK